MKRREIFEIRRFRVKEVLPKTSEEKEIEELPNPSTTKKSRVDDDKDEGLGDDGQIWSKPLAEARETTRFVNENLSLRLFDFFSSFRFREDEFEEYLQGLFV